MNTPSVAAVSSISASIPRQHGWTQACAALGFADGWNEFYTFVTDGIEAALEVARAAAGDKNVGIWCGADIMREYLKAGLLDEMQIHLIPILLRGGVRLFEDLDPEGIELRRTSSIKTPGGATHFRFEVVK